MLLESRSESSEREEQRAWDYDAAPCRWCRGEKRFSHRLRFPPRASATPKHWRVRTGSLYCNTISSFRNQFRNNPCCFPHPPLLSWSGGYHGWQNPFPCLFLLAKWLSDLYCWSTECQTFFGKQKIPKKPKRKSSRHFPICSTGFSYHQRGIHSHNHIRLPHLPPLRY